MLLPCRLVRGQMPAASGFKHSSISGRRPLAQRQRGRPQHPRHRSRSHLLHPSPSYWRPGSQGLQIEAASKDSPEKVSGIKIIIADIQPRFISTTAPPVPSENSCGGGDAGVSCSRNQKRFPKDLSG